MILKFGVAPEDDVCALELLEATLLLDFAMLELLGATEELLRAALELDLTLDEDFAITFKVSV